MAASGPAAAADVLTLRISRGFDLAELPLVVAEHDHLIEKQALARGLGADRRAMAAAGRRLGG